MYPVHRARRLRKTPVIRSLVRETRIHNDQLVYPIFIAETSRRQTPVESMPGISQHSLDSALEECLPLYRNGISHFLLFGVTERKDSGATSAYDEKGVVQQAIRKMKQEMPDSVIFTDVCLCAYTDHGHCGIIKNGLISNDESVDVLARVALSHAQAGADFVSPSDMMDGRISVTRRVLDENGFQETGILAYAAKFSSGFYGPFREAAHSAPQFGDRKTHQMDPANRLEALKEIESDIEEGADIVMVKPALSYLDIIREARNRFLVPVAAYNVSGEYSMVKAAAMNGWIDEKTVRNEILLSMRRAGADIIITYFARDIALESIGPS
jgi:porphobilinogen synthase